MPTRLCNFIADQECAPRSGAYLEKTDPATGGRGADVPDSNADDVDDAVRAAKKAFEGWSRTPVSERSRLLLKLADTIDANLDELARAESLDTGKPLALARSVDIPRSASNFRFFATAILHTRGDLFETEAPPPSQAVGVSAGGGAAGMRALNYTLRRPRGVAGLISPWNLPLYLLTWKIAPALAAGNTAVCKPSEVTPTTASMLGKLAAETGLPAGVLNIVHGRGGRRGRRWWSMRTCRRFRSRDRQGWGSGSLNMAGRS
jgi:aminomuconate-semialdehyde/2-hydroxymuconate-6-semialdehyde dehydrogenase